MQLERKVLVLAAAVLAAFAGASVPARAGLRAVCPTSKPAPALASRPGAATMLVPLGSDAVLLCRYAGLNPASRAGRLLRSRLVVVPAVVQQLVHELDALPALPPGAVFACPMDDGSEILDEFEYATGPPDTVTVDLTGCTTATNGHVTRMASSAIVAQLEALVG